MLGSAGGWLGKGGITGNGRQPFSFGAQEEQGEASSKEPEQRGIPVVPGEPRLSGPGGSGQMRWRVDAKIAPNTFRLFLPHGCCVFVRCSLGHRSGFRSQLQSQVTPFVPKDDANGWH